MHNWTLQDLPDKERGTIFRDIEVSRNSYGMALRATDDIPVNTEIARAPFTKCLSLYSAAMSPLGSILNMPNFKANLPGVEAHDVEKLVLNVHLMWELDQGAKSDMYPWLALWPANPSNLQYFTPRELQELQDPFLVETYFMTENAYYDEYLALRPLCFLYPEVFKLQDFTYEKYKKAAVLVSTRYFNTQVSIQLPPNPGTQSPSEPLPARPWYTGEVLNVVEVMIPVMDSINHASLYPYCNEDVERGVDTFRFDNVSRVYSLHTLVPFKAGEEVQWCYNANANRELLSEYGFALSLQDNPWETVHLARHMALGLTHDRRDMEAAPAFVIKAAEFLNEQTSVAHAASFALYTCEPKGFQDAECAKFAKDSLAHFIDSYPTTVEQDRVTLANRTALEEIGDYGHHIVQFRIAQKELLAKMLRQLTTE